MPAGYAVHKEQALISDDVQGLTHFLGLLGIPGAHVVVDAGHMGQGGNVFSHNLMNAFRVVVHKNGTGTGIHLAAERFHGLVQHDFLTTVVKCQC